MRPPRRMALGIAAFALVAACTGDDDAGPSSSATSQATTSTSTLEGTTTPPSTTAPPPTAVSTTAAAASTTMGPPGVEGAYPMAAAEYCVVDTASWDHLNVRSGPGTEYEVIGELAYDAVAVAGTGWAAQDGLGREWIEIDDSAGRGWVAGWFVTGAPCTASTGLASAAGFREPFSSFAPVPLLEGGTAAIADHPDSLQGVYWDFRVPLHLSDRLARDGFAIDSTFSSDVLHTIYSYTGRYADGPVFVTTDAAYHVWHQVFSKVLRSTETEELLPALEDLVLGLVGAARSLGTELTGTALEPAVADVVAFFEVTATLLGLDVGSVGEDVAREVELVELHAGFAEAPTVGALVDYSLFAPRGHYTRSEELTRYFKAMSHLGQTPFSIDEPDRLRRAALAARILVADPGLLDLWERIYETTSFIVGAADDYTPVELMEAMSGIDDLADDAQVAALADRLRTLRPVLIDAERPSARVMGARFVIDSYVLDQLADPELPGRLEVSVLDVAAAFGSDWALERQRLADVPATFSGYEASMARLRYMLGNLPVEAWATSIYNAWLYAIGPMWLPHGDEFPDYMRGQAWAAKAHQTGFGSYAELKHDTVLYAKQGFAEGDQPLPPAPPRHWVEPDPVPFARLAAVARLLDDGLDTRGLLTDETAALLDEVAAMFDRFARIAGDELAGLPISSDDNEWLAGIGTQLELLWLASGDGGEQVGGFAADPDSRAPIVVDIFSNPFNALEIATGGFDYLYVLVPNDEGVFQVAIGAVYSFYEFWVPRGERLTDEEWRLRVRDDPPPRPAWLDGLHLSADS